MLLSRLAPWLYLGALLCCFAFSSPNTACASDRFCSDEAPWQLVWSDEFEQDGAINRDKWVFDIGGGIWGNEEQQYYTDRLENCRVENGHLTIEIKREAFQLQEITSCRIKSAQSWTYGRIDVRAKLPSGIGTWPAIWMLPTIGRYGNLGWPDNGEIDIMEHAGQETDRDRILGSIYSKNHMWWDQTGISQYHDVPGAETDYHIYSVQWTENSIQLMVDGVVYNSFENPRTSWEDWPFDQNFRLIMNVAAGGWAGDVDVETLPQQLWIDYVRVYQQQPQLTNQIASNTGLFW